MQKLGVFKVRTLNHDEKIIHLPEYADGHMILYKKEDGSYVLKPVHP
jgi:hypothetical protein